MRTIYWISNIYKDLYTHFPLARTAPTRAGRGSVPSHSVVLTSTYRQTTRRGGDRSPNSHNLLGPLQNHICVVPIYHHHNGIKINYHIFPLYNNNIIIIITLSCCLDDSIVHAHNKLHTFKPLPNTQTKSRPFTTRRPRVKQDISMSARPSDLLTQWPTDPQQIRPARRGRPLHKLVK